LEDPFHCGGCNSPCDVGYACVEGTCACEGNALDCEGVCINVSNDDANCGGCGILCARDEKCMMGECVCQPNAPDCVAGSTGSTGDSSTGSTGDSSSSGAG
jgi:hypothetical protein